MTEVNGSQRLSLNPYTSLTQVQYSKVLKQETLAHNRPSLRYNIVFVANENFI